VVPTEPSDLELATRAVLNGVSRALQEGGALQRMLANPDLAVRQAADTLRGVARMADALWPAPGSSLTGPIGRQRRYAWARASLEDIKTIKRELGGTVNDVFLAVISGAFRALLVSRGEEPAPSMVPSLIPVSMRSEGEESIYGNRVSALVATLPIDIADPVERLDGVRTQMLALKASNEAGAGEALVSLGRHVPFPLASMFVRLAFSIPQREIVTVTTNVPGPQRPLYGLGRRLVEIIPYVPIATTVRIGVSIFTYNGNVTFGITGDYATTPDIDVFAERLEEGVAQLLAATTSRSRKQHRDEHGRFKKTRGNKSSSGRAAVPPRQRVPTT
jgi:diacylglycerol O-acyltransferase